MCLIPGNPDITGIGIRIAIYVQNILSFGPAFYSLINDRKVDLKELQTIEKQSTTILITAFAILISLIVQALRFNLSAFHTSLVLSLSWMNNTNTFIYFVLYIHHKSHPDQGQKPILPQWSEWYSHITQPLRLRTKTCDGDVEMNDLKGMPELQEKGLHTHVNDRCKGCRVERFARLAR
jgi:hypothetical protein